MQNKNICSNNIEKKKLRERIAQPVRAAMNV